MAPSSLGRAQHRAHNAGVRAAPAQVTGELLLDLIGRRMRHLTEQRLRGHDHPVCAVAALGCLFGNEGSLDSVRVFGCAQTLEGSNRTGRGLPHGSHAGTHGFPVHQHGAGSALTEPTTELRAVQPERIPQHVEERLVWIPGIDCDRAAVDSKTVIGQGEPPYEGGTDSRAATILQSFAILLLAYALLLKSNRRCYTTASDVSDLESLARERFKDLIPAEIELLRKADKGEFAACGPSIHNDDPVNDPSKADEWGDDRCAIVERCLSVLTSDDRVQKQISNLHQTSSAIATYKAGA
jgi:hypothetical protein